MEELVFRKGDIVRWESKGLPRYLTKEEVHRVLALCERNIRDHFLINTLWNTGARVSEVLNIRVSDIDFTNRIVRIITLKKKKALKERVIPVKPEWIGEAGAYITRKGIKEKLFPINRFRVYQIVRKWLIKAGIERERAHPHVFRHSFAVNCILSGVPLIVLKEWLGHSSILTTAVYLKVIPRDSMKFIEKVEF